jgi:hypothetical protein
MSAIERFIKATDAAWASASWAAEDVASASAAMNDYMKARDILRSELAARDMDDAMDTALIALNEYDKENTPLIETHKCNTHPNAPHGFLRNASHNAGRYVCECEHWKENT